MVCPAVPTEPKTHKANRKKQLFISQSPFRSHRLISGLVRLYPIRSKPGTKPCLQNPFTCQYLSMAAGLNCTYLHILIGPYATAVELFTGPLRNSRQDHLWPSPSPIPAERTNMKPTKPLSPALPMPSAILLTATLAMAPSATRYLHVKVTNPTSHELVRVNVPL